MNPNDWAKNPNPKFPYPMCSYCLYETDCQQCQAITLRALAVYEMFRIEDWLFDTIMCDILKKNKKVEFHDDGMVDDVHTILEGEKSVEKKTNKKRNRRKVRNRKGKDEKKVVTRRKRTTKRKRKKAVASDAEEKVK
jgi:hypothetical protein